MEKYIIPKGTVVDVDDSLLCWDKVAFVVPEKDTTKVVLENGHWLIIEKPFADFKKGLFATSKEA